jgi:CubicO group peptidase (beta-lactamase class C family)
MRLSHARFARFTRLVALVPLALIVIVALPAGASAVQGAAFPVATPESQGISADALRELAAVARGYVAADLAVGCELLVIKNRHTVLHEAFGMADRERGVAMVPGTIFNLRSMTKMFTGVAIQMLIETGDLELDMKAADFLEGFRNKKSEAITIGELLAHRSGLLLSIMMKTGKLDAYKSLIEMANAVGEGGPDYPPDSKYWYSDSGTDCLAAIVEIVTGKDISNFVSERIFAPLGMTDSFYLTKITPHDASRVASMYVGNTGAWTRGWNSQTPPFYPYPWGSQTAFATLDNYARFLTMILDHGKASDAKKTELLTAEAVERILTPRSLMAQLGSDSPFPTGFRGLTPWYGQMSVLHFPTSPAAALPTGKPVVFGHSGSDGTNAWVFPERDLLILYFTQSRGGVTPIRIETEIDRLFLHPAGADGKSAPDAKVPAKVPEPFAKLVGRYHVGFDEVRVLSQDDKLLIDLPDSLVFDLVKSPSDAEWKAPIGGFSVTFEFLDALGRVQDGAATTLTIKDGTNTRKYLAGAASPEPVETPERLAALVGDYHEEGTSQVDHFQIEGARLAVVIAGRPGELTLRGPDEAGWRALLSDSTRAVKFDVNADGTVPSLTWRTGAVESKWKRAPGKADGH